MSNGKRSSSGRHGRRQLPPLRLGVNAARPYYAALVDVREHRGTTSGVPWSALIRGDPSEDQQIPQRTITGETISDLWRDVHDELQEIGDEVGNIVGTKWMLDGDTVAWMELHDRERLDDVPVGVPGGIPTYRFRVGE